MRVDRGTSVLRSAGAARDVEKLIAQLDARLIEQPWSRAEQMGRSGSAPTPPTNSRHPGERMREILAGFQVSVVEAARRMHVSRQTLHAVLAGRSSVTAELALRFGRLTGTSPEPYLDMQSRYRLWHARRQLGWKK